MLVSCFRDPKVYLRIGPRRVSIMPIEIQRSDFPGTSFQSASKQRPSVKRSARDQIANTWFGIGMLVRTRFHTSMVECDAMPVYTLPLYLGRTWVGRLPTYKTIVAMG